MRDTVRKPAPSDIANQIATLSPAKRALLDKIADKGKADGNMLVAKTLKELGITHAYCLAGTPIDKTMAACIREGIRVLGVRHQQAAVMMSLAQNYTTGRLVSIAIASLGPAVTNTVTSVLNAREDCWPVIVLGGRQPVDTQHMGCFQDLDAIPIFEPITKWAAVVEKTEDIPEYIERAFHIATEGRPGPVYLDLPVDVLTGAGTMTSRASTQTEPPALDKNAIKHAADLLANAKRPALLLGKGVRWSAPFEELARLVEKLEMPFTTSPMGRGFLPDDHPLCFNGLSTDLQGGADVVLLAGGRMNWTFRYGSELAKDVKLIQIDIAPEEIGRNITPTVGITGDIKDVLQALLQEIELNTPSEAIVSSRRDWLETMDEKRQARNQKLDSLAHANTLPMTPFRMCKEIRDFIPRDAIITVDGSIVMAAVQQILPSHLPASRLTAGVNGCMGTAVPYGIGAKLANPDRMVIAISGDAGFGFNAMEMEMAVRYRIPVIFIVANNGGIIGSLPQKIICPPDYPERVALFEPGIRYEKIMEAFGGHCECVSQPEEIGPALTRAVESGMPACINIQIDPDTPFLDHMG